MEEKKLSEEESLKIITEMISKAKSDYRESGVSALLWGAIITICSIVSFLGAYFEMPFLNNIWWLTIVAVVFQIIFSIRENRKRKFKTNNEDAMGGIWISFGIAMFLFSYFVNTGNVDHANSIFLITYGIPTFATGFTRRFKPMIFGGIICWILAILNIYTPAPYNILYNAVAAQMAWFVPGLILRKRCSNVKAENV
jgi:phosphatidylglycerophosphatase A